MQFSLLHAGLAGGAALAVVPLILHLLMRQTPKHIIFPALRLIRDRQKQSKKRLRVKNWLLLLARMALFALMALALARPTLTTDALLGEEDVDAAIALVVDTSLSMEYTERGNDRLKEAKLRIADILKRVTDKSEIFVIDSAEPSKPAPISPALALKRVDALTLRDVNRSLNASVLLAYAAVGESKLPRRAVYVLTDMAKSAWDLGSTSVADAAKKANALKPPVATYLNRLTPKEVKDVAIVAADPVSTVATQGEALEIKVKVRSWGPKDSRNAKFYLDKTARGEKLLELPANGEVEISFSAPNTLTPGLHQGEVRLSGGPDSMTFDDVRYFSFVVQPAQRVLIVADLPIDAVYTQLLLEPTNPPPGLPQLVKVDRMDADEFARKARSKLKDYAAVFLLNVKQLSEADWSALNAYVREGGGLVVGLGDRANLDSYNGRAASQLLPAKLDRIKREPANTFFAKPDPNHPIFNRFAREFDAAFALVPVYRAWTVSPQGGRTLLSLTDGSPALLERPFQGTKTGHVMLWVTPFRRHPFVEDAWNEFPGSWSFLSLLETVAYLSGSAGEQLNYDAGQDAILPIDPARKSANYAVHAPDPKQDFTLAAPTSDKLVVPTPQSIGQWKVEGKSADGETVVTGFSVNAPEGEATVVPLEEKELFALFGTKAESNQEDRILLSNDAAGLARDKNTITVGREIFPWLMFLILLLVTLENLLANKFHRERVPATSAA